MRFHWSVVHVIKRALYHCDPLNCKITYSFMWKIYCSYCCYNQALAIRIGYCISFTILMDIGLSNITGHSKKVYCDLDHVEKCGFLHDVQHVSNNIFEAFLDIANFWPFLLYFMGTWKKKFFKLLKMEQNWFYLIEQASEISKITISVIVYAPCLNKTTKKTNKKQMNSSADTFFWMTRYHNQIFFRILFFCSIARRSMKMIQST